MNDKKRKTLFVNLGFTQVHRIIRMVRSGEIGLDNRLLGSSFESACRASKEEKCADGEARHMHDQMVLAWFADTFADLVRVRTCTRLVQKDVIACACVAFSEILRAYATKLGKESTNE